jgi:DNA modification methylase
MAMFSPPYGSARTYSIGFNLEGEAFIDWLMPVFHECRRICTGPVFCVIAGKTKDFCYDCLPERLTVRLRDAGFNVRKPTIFNRAGIPGGSPDYFRSDYEPVLCVSRPGRLPYSNPTACGTTPRYKPGGAMSYRGKDGSRRNGTAPNGCKNGDLATREYKPPKVVKASDVIKVAVGGGRMGDPLAHCSEAPFAESLVEHYVLTFSRPGDTILDPFVGSGTTVATAHKYGRHGIGIDIRESQIEICRQRLERVQPEIFI